MAPRESMATMAALSAMSLTATVSGNSNQGFQNHLSVWMGLPIIGTIVMTTIITPSPAYFSD